MSPINIWQQTIAHDLGCILLCRAKILLYLPRHLCALSFLFARWFFQLLFTHPLFLRVSWSLRIRFFFYLLGRRFYYGLRISRSRVLRVVWILEQKLFVLLKAFALKFLRKCHYGKFFAAACHHKIRILYLLLLQASLVFELELHLGRKVGYPHSSTQVHFPSIAFYLLRVSQRYFVSRITS